MKRIIQSSVFLLVAMLMPLAAIAETQTITSTFTGHIEYDAEESWSTGILTTAEGNDWRWYGAGNPNWPDLGMVDEFGTSCLMVKPHARAFTINSLMPLQGKLKEVSTPLPAMSTRSSSPWAARHSSIRSTARSPMTCAPTAWISAMRVRRSSAEPSRLTSPPRGQAAKTTGSRSI